MAKVLCSFFPSVVGHKTMYCTFRPRHSHGQFTCVAQVLHQGLASASEGAAPGWKSGITGGGHADSSLPSPITNITPSLFGCDRDPMHDCSRSWHHR
jgi:hypothetical protein